MSVGVFTCPPETPIDKLAAVMLEKQLEAVVVQDAEGHAVGVVSEYELVQAYGRGDFNGLSAEDIMRDDVPQMPPELPLPVASQIMQDQKIRTVFLMHHAGGIEYPAALLSYRNLLRHIAMQEDAEIDDLGVMAERKLPLETFIEKRDAARKQNIPDE